MNFLRKLFDQPVHPLDDPNYSQDILMIETALAHLPPDNARHMACFGLLLARVANADRVVTKEECLRMLQVLLHFTTLTQKDAEVVVMLATQKTLAHTLEEHLVFRHLNKVCTRENKIAMVHALFHSASESDISSAEEQDIRFITRSLLLSEKDFMDIRAQYSEHLAILKNLPGGKL